MRHTSSRAHPPGRSPERLREHYEIEKELAARLRAAPREQRRHLYTQVYDELFRRVPDHPQLVLKDNPQFHNAMLAEQVRLLRPFLHPGCTVLEIGCGDCALARAIAPQVKAVYAVDVSPTIMEPSCPLPPNVICAVSDGCAIPVPGGCADLAFSNQLMEHLHPDDAVAQLREVAGALAPGGRYICITPNRLSGPYDISRYFDRVAAGFHLKEYTLSELAALFMDAGFSRLRVMLGASRKMPLSVPVAPVRLLEHMLLLLPAGLAAALARRMPPGVLRVIRLVGVKQ